MPQNTELIEKLTSELITHLSGFQPTDENFSICMQYVNSNLKYHNFLDPDSNKITRSINGLIEKLQIHCHDEKAQLLDKQVSRFLDLPAFEWRERGKTNTHWAVLSLLLKLSTSPVNSSYMPTEKKKKKGKEDNFDWYAYLMEGEEPYIPPVDDSSDEDFDLENDVHPKHNVTFAPDVSTHKAEETLVSSSDRQSDALAWLEQNVVVEYWKRGQTIHPSQHDSSCFSLQLEEQKERDVEVYVREPSVQVTEYQVVRESIWLLLGADESFIFQREQDEWTVRPNVQLSHITHSALCSSLQSILRYSGIVRKVRRFLETTPTSGDQVPQTYQAFRGALWDFHIQFQHYLAQVEKSVLKQEETATIISLTNLLSARLADYDVIDHILRNGIDACADVTDNTLKACTLLASMYHLMTSCHVHSEDSAQISLVLSLWVQSCKPYLDKIDKWLYEGVLHDPGQEFIIRVNEDVDDESYWDKGFTLHCLPEQTGYDNTEDSHFAPVFLTPVLHQLIMAGKSMHLLFKLGKVAQVYPGPKRQTLYEAFIASIEEYLGTPTENDSTDSARAAAKQPDRLPQKVFTEHIGKQMALKQLEDPLLLLNFTNIVARANLSQDVEEEDKLSKALSEVQLNPLSPIQLMLRHCLYAHISERADTVCSNLLNVLKSEYHLFSYFFAVKRYYLMEAGDTMYDFCTELFEKLRHREDWKDVSYLNVIMQECLHARFPQDEDRLFVNVEEREEKARDRMPIKALDSLTLEFKTPWPVSSVLNSKCMQIYNTVFRFLLAIKRAKFGLDGLRFSELERSRDYDAMSESAADDSILQSSVLEPSRDQLIRDMHMLRFKLLCFVNSLHNYIMTRIVHSTSMEFEETLQKANDFDDVIKAHNHYVTTLHKRCLQHKETKFTKEIVTRVLNLAVKFSTMWDNGIDKIRHKKIAEVESEYSKCVQFLSTFFNKVIKRGSFAHLEPLAFALDSSYGQKLGKP